MVTILNIPEVRVTYLTVYVVPLYVITLLEVQSNVWPLTKELYQASTLAKFLLLAELKDDPSVNAVL